MNPDKENQFNALPRWLIAVMIFTSGMVIGQTLS